MSKKFLFLTSFVLVLSPAYNSYGAGDGYAPKPNPMKWRFVPATMGPNSITMRATTALDANNMPVKYYFECTNHGEATSGWRADANYTATNLAPSTTYSIEFKFLK